MKRISSAIAAMAVLLVAVACSGGADEGSTGTPSDDVAPEYVRQRAPIDSLEVTNDESVSLRYVVHVTSGLPSGCVTFDAIETTRDGNTIAIAVWNLVPGPDTTFGCTDDFRSVENNVALGTDFEPGDEYRVEVNDVVETFTAQ